VETVDVTFSASLAKWNHTLNPSGVHTNLGGNWSGIWEDWKNANPTATLQQLLEQLSDMRGWFNI
jgi:hypothetical protein